MKMIGVAGSESAWMSAIVVGGDWMNCTPR
jgi:hypothetical protein